MSVMSSTGRTKWGIALAPLKERRRGWKVNQLLLKHSSIYANLKTKQCFSSSDLLAHHIPRSSGFCAPGCTCPRALPLELGWGAPPPGCGTVCEAGRYVPGSSCRLPQFPWTAEVPAVAVQRIGLVQTTTTRAVTTGLGQKYRGGHGHAPWEESCYYVQLWHELGKLKENNIQKCRS